MKKLRKPCLTFNWHHLYNKCFKSDWDKTTLYFCIVNVFAKCINLYELHNLYTYFLSNPFIPGLATLDAFITLLKQQPYIGSVVLLDDSTRIKSTT